MEIFQRGRPKPEPNKPSVGDLFTEGRRPSPREGSSSAGTSLDALLAHEGLASSLLNSNTFFHGKVGFYESVIGKICMAAKQPSAQFRYVHSLKELPKPASRSKTSLSQPLICLPIVKSEDDVNAMLAEVLHLTDAVWFVARPSSIRQHLLVNFHSFFLASGTPAEMSPLREVFRLPDEVFNILTGSSQSSALFVSDHKSIVEKLGKPPVITILLSDFV